MKITTIELPIYNLDIIVILDSWELANKKFKLDLGEDDYSAVAWTIYGTNDTEIFVLLKMDHLKYLHHELFHVISALCKMRGLMMDPDNDEALAYCQGYIAEKMLAFVEKEKNKLEKT